MTNPARTGAPDPLGPLRRGPVAVVGYGHQGEAQALNLRDSGLAVIVGARPGLAGASRAAAAGFEVRDLEDAARAAATVAVMLPDEVVPGRWAALRGALRDDALVVFAHGYNLLYGALDFPAQADVVLVSPTAPGRILRERFERGEGVPAYLAVHRDGSGAAWAAAAAYAHGLGSTRAGVLRTTVREETEVDLFGEQVVLCGGMNALVTAAFETLVERGYTPEVAYLECVHQLAHLAELLRQRGVAGMRDGISATALYGDLTRGPRVIGAASRAEMRRILDEIRSGAFAAEWSREAAAGKPTLEAERSAARRHPIEAARRAALGLPEEPEPRG